MAKYHSFVCMSMCVCDIFLIHLSIEGHLGCLHVLAIVSDVAVHMGVQIAFPVSVSGSCQCMHRRRMEGLHGSFDFNFLRGLHNVFKFMFPVLIYISTNCVQGFSFFYILTTHLLDYK